MAAIETVTGRVTNPGAAFAALTPNSGNTFTVRAHPQEGTAFLAEMWTQQATAGALRVKSPRMHDDVVGIRAITQAADIRRVLPEEARQTLYPTDELTVEMTGGAAEVDSAALFIYYEQLGGINARLMSWEEISPRIEHLYMHPVAVAGPATSGDWSAGTRLDTTADEFKANRDYALLGYTLDAPVLSVAIAGSDTGNLKVGGPGPLLADETRAFFVDQSRRLGKPCIPIINAANRQGTLVHVARITAAGTVNVTLCFGLLR
jgi:hypothetical protein